MAAMDFPGVCVGYVVCEDPELYCQECSERIPSAYAEPEDA
jgi:hypothetical protein